ncbi:hypothetical protein ACA910_022118 [Epithemia clementina (nom. ined.)]
MTSTVPASPSTSSASILQYRSVADDYRMSRVHLASQVHKAIRDGEYAWLPDLVVASPTNHNNGGSTNISLNLNNNDNNAAEILWEANSSGWTALHYAASHFLPLEWWRWILERAVSGSPSCGSDNSNHINGYHHRFQTVRNDLGETVLDIFFRSFLAPLPWQSTQVKNCSKLLLQAMDRVCGDPTLLRQTEEGSANVKLFYLHQSQAELEMVHHSSLPLCSVKGVR